MRFSDLSDRDRRRPAAKPAAPEKAAPPAKAHIPVKPAPPVKVPATLPLDSPLPDFPVIGPSAPPPAAPPVRQDPAVPAGRSPARVEKVREEGERPFGELDPLARELYAGAIVLARDLLTSIDRPYLDGCDRFVKFSDILHRGLAGNPLLLRYTFHATADDYLYAHSANVAVISQAVGLAMGLDKGDLGLLGFCALAHDIGMTSRSALANSDRRLTDAEYEDFMRHSEEGAEKIGRMLGLDQEFKERAADVILQVHERIDASGYPDRLKNGEIGQLAQIIGIADVYEAMSHPRPWRRAAHPHEAVKYLIEKEGRGFDSSVVKAVMRALSIYPPGSLVSLSGGEIGEVVRVNRHSLTRPVVSVLLDKDFNPVARRLVDLLQHPLAGIENIVDETELAARNPKFSAQRELARWWVEW